MLGIVFKLGSDAELQESLASSQEGTLRLVVMWRKRSSAL
jgi:hypothetical protein